MNEVPPYKTKEWRRAVDRLAVQIQRDYNHQQWQQFRQSLHNGEWKNNLLRFLGNAGKSYTILCLFILWLGATIRNLDGGEIFWLLVIPATWFWLMYGDGKKRKQSEGE